MIAFKRKEAPSSPCALQRMDGFFFFVFAFIYIFIENELLIATHPFFILFFFLSLIFSADFLHVPHAHH